MSNHPTYRPNVACIVKKGDRILVCERCDTVGGWQFPQGGVDPGESAADALARELEEEIGLPPAGYEITLAKGPYRYLFSDGKRKEGYQGQEQTYFLVRLLNENWKFESLRCPAGEFRDAQWIKPYEFRLDWVPPFKHKVYRKVFQDFFKISLS